MESVKSRLAEKNLNLDDIAINDLILEHSDIFFDEVADVFNFIFEYKNEGYTEVSTEWLEDNVSIRHFQMILEEIAEQSRMAWLFPFFKSRLVEILEKTTPA